MVETMTVACVTGVERGRGEFRRARARDGERKGTPSSLARGLVPSIPFPFPF